MGMACLSVGRRAACDLISVDRDPTARCNIVFVRPQSARAQVSILFLFPRKIFHDLKRRSAGILSEVALRTTRNQPGLNGSRPDARVTGREQKLMTVCSGVGMPAKPRW